MLPTLIHHLRRHRRGCLALLATLALGLWPTPPGTPEGRPLEEGLAREFLQVHTRNTPTTHYQGREGPSRFEYELVRRFAAHPGGGRSLRAGHHIARVRAAGAGRGGRGAARPRVA